MLLCQKKDVFIRYFNDNGYIVDCINGFDSVFDKNGAIFLKALSRQSKTLENITAEIASKYNNAAFETIEKDTLEFFSYLEQKGFVVSGNDEDELAAKDIRFSYKTIGEKKIAMQSDAFTSGKTVNSETFFMEHNLRNPTMLSLQIEILNSCNERCIHCYIPNHNNKEILDKDTILSVLEQFRSMGGLFLTISGGEAMIHPHFIEILNKAKKMDLAVTVLSNLTLLTDDIIIELKEPSLSIVQTSLYSMTPEIHDSITRISGSFKKTYDGIMRLKENDIPVKLSCPLMKQNMGTYKDVYQFGLDNSFPTGLDYLMSACSDHSIVNLENRMPVDGMLGAIQYLLETDTLHQERIYTRVFTQVDKNTVGDELLCNACFNSMAITAVGDAIPCAMWYEYRLGNCKNIPLYEIWHNSDEIKALRAIRKKNFTRCMSCEHINYCVLCMAKFANENPHGDHFVITDSTCKASAFYREAAMSYREKNKTIKE